MHRNLCVIIACGCVLLLGILPQAGMAQDYHLAHFGVTEGLPSSEVYCILQDRHGFLWFGTDRGAVRYNGYRFEVFTTDQGLPDNTVFKLFEDVRGRVWFGCFSPTLSWYENGKVEPYEYNSSILKGAGANSPKTDLVVGKDGSVCFGTVNQGMVVLDSRGELRLEGMPSVGQCRLWNGYFISATMAKSKVQSEGGPDIELPEGKNFILESAPGKYSFELEEKSTYLPLAEGAIAEDGFSAVSLGWRVHLFQEGNRFKVLTMESVPSRVFLDQEGRLWVGLKDRGVRVFDREGNLLPIHFPQLRNFTVSDIIQDREGNFWFSTTQQGIFFLPSLKFGYLAFPSENTQPISDLVCASDTTAYLSLDHDGLYMATISEKDAWKVKKLHSGFVNATRLIWDKPSKRLWLANQHIYSLQDQGLEMLRQSSITQGAKSFVLRKGGGFWIGGRRGLFSYDGDSTSIYAQYEPGFGTWALFEDNAGRLWLGSQQGLYKFPDSEPYFSVEAQPSLHKRVAAISSLPDGRMVVGTMGAGIVLVDGDSVEVVDEKAGLPSNLINCLAVDDDGVIWAGSGRGLHRVDPRPKGRPLVQNFGQGEGMPFLEVHRVATSADKVWLAGPEGISVLDRKARDAALKPPPIFLRTLRVNGKDVPAQADFIFPHRENDLRFSYLGLRFRVEGQLGYRYRLEGLDKEWRYTKDTAVSYPGLVPGQYRFEVAAGSDQMGWSEVPASVDLEITPAFWQRWWFVPVLALLVLLFAGAVAWYFFRQWSQRVKREKSLEEWKMKALRARMDPHFTFNSLNTIQAYIATHDTLAAEKYLNKFSRLVRLVLHQSDTETISLAEEVEMLTLYLELEQMRFGSRFKFEIKIDPGLDQESTGIPGLLVQPLAENAIKHGLLPARGNGQLRIAFTREGPSLRCSVKDDGIGREAARALRVQRADHHRSAGLELVRSRLQLLQSSPAGEDPIRIVDLKDEQGQALGTEFTFLIPFTSIH